MCAPSSLNMGEMPPSHTELYLILYEVILVPYNLYSRSYFFWALNLLYLLHGFRFLLILVLMIMKLFC